MPSTGIYVTWEAAAVIMAGVGMLAAAAALFVRREIRVALADFKDALLAGIALEYVNRDVCHERHCAVEQRFAALEGN